MFYLRRVLEDNVINDQVLGSSYSLIESFTNQDEFNRSYKMLFKLTPEEDKEWIINKWKEGYGATWICNN